MTGMPFNQQMGFPVELTLRTTKDGIRLHRAPVEEISRIHGREWSWKSQRIDPGHDLLEGIVGDSFDILAEIAVGEAAEIGIAVRGIPVVYDVRKRLLTCDQR
jgi:fructan beta-fructosidase